MTYISDSQANLVGNWFLPPRSQAEKLFLVLVGADQLNGLVSRLCETRNRLDGGDSIEKLTVEGLEDIKNGCLHLVALLGKSAKEIALEAQRATAGIQKASENGKDWQTPAGSYFTSLPLGKDAKFSFVYPGAFNTYPGVGRDFFHLFPNLIEPFYQITSDPRRALRPELVFPPHLDQLDSVSISVLENGLMQDAVAMMTSGTAISVLCTLILRRILGINPHFAFGYSLGECSMLYALECWHATQESFERIEFSPLFHTRLSGPKEAVRDYWQITNSDVPVLWGNHILMATPEEVIPHVRGSTKVFLTHINSPGQVVIGGEPAECQRVISAVGCLTLQAPFDYVLHCPAMAAEENALAYMNTWPTQIPEEIHLISAAYYDHLPETSERVGQALGRMLCAPLNFANLIEKVYAEGARIFIEAGAGSNCSRWIEETLKGKPFLSVPINRRGMSDQASLLRLAARLACHHVDFQIEALVNL